eukprot:CAMPEP_0114991030 /NCGR_PEP_ID=MMETSP0216-20121206/11133_1 /TAXON_ID=223996 /ORGANISM="Protocruzia adherens, Strain Boccale" /LENGTH=121 /DNA_ID=CAMNT_0002354287 /DNA_START=2216 /DNA_END=2581 /DNA_ORIENTATION=-
MRVGYFLILVLSLTCTCHCRWITSSEDLPNVEKIDSVENHAKINNLTPQQAHDATIVPEYGDNIMYSGYVEVNSKTGSSIYFSFYESQTGNPEDVPLVLWLQGGPGSSSMFGDLVDKPGYR